MKKIALAIHGGAGTILKAKMTSEKEQAYKIALQNALTAGYQKLLEKATAVAAVETAVISLEDSPLFNAGKGSVFSAEGNHEMDASIMDGLTLDAGSVAGITGVRNPIELCRIVMEKSPHVFLIGEGAEAFAKLHNVDFESQEYFFDQFRFEQWQQLKGSNAFKLDHSTPTDEKFGTVGAVALDEFGNVAAATSTGGMTNKKFGRVGDSSIIGAGTYANNKTCAISCTGNGEYFIRGVVAYDVSCLMEMKGYDLKTAADEVVHQRLPRIKGDGGLVGIDTHGNIVMPFNTEGMYRASIDINGQVNIEIYK